MAGIDNILSAVFCIISFMILNVAGDQHICPAVKYSLAVTHPCSADYSDSIDNPVVCFHDINRLKPGFLFYQLDKSFKRISVLKFNAESGIGLSVETVYIIR